MSKTFTFSFNEVDLQTVLMGLQELPLRTSMNIYSRLIQDAQKQSEAVPEVVDKSLD